MTNIVTGDVTKILVAQARLLVGPPGVAAPTRAPMTGLLTWDVSMKEVGYTEKGVESTYTPTKKGYGVDEELGDVLEILTGEKLNIQTVLSQTTMKNFSQALAAAAYSATAAASGVVGTSRISLGSGALQEFTIGLEGLSPEGFPAYFIGWRGRPGAAVKRTWSKVNVTSLAFSVDFLVDSSKALGSRLCIYDEMNAVALP